MADVENFNTPKAATVSCLQDRVVIMSGAGLPLIPSMVPSWGSAAPSVDLPTDVVIGGTRRVHAPVVTTQYANTNSMSTGYTSTDGITNAAAALAKQGAPPRREPR